jgi:hypothetical protein
MVASQACVIHNDCGGFESARFPLAGHARTIGGLRRHCILSFGYPTIDLLIARGDCCRRLRSRWMQTIAGSPLKVSHNA